MPKRIAAPALVLGLLALCAGRLWLAAQSARPASTPTDPAARTLLIRFGVTAKTGKNWSGRLEPESADAQIVSLTGYHFQPPDSTDAAQHSWQFATRPWAPVFQQVDLSPARPGPRPVFPNGIYASVKGASAARFKLVSDTSAFSFSLADLSGQKLVTFADGNIELEEVPTQSLLSDNAAEADFPALAARAAGGLAVAWQEYSGDHDRVTVREYDGARWLAPETIDFPETRDVFRPAVAYDANDSLHVVWPAQVDGNWDLYERRKTAQGWQPVERLTTAAGTDLHPKMATDPKGNLWLVWQTFRDGQFDIFLKRFSEGKWDTGIRVSESAANDWEPAIAAAPDGTIWVGWDSYDRRNYDVFVRPIRNGTPGPVRAITRSPRLEAHVSLACDPQSRLWIAFDEAESNWGKDYGYLVKDRGNPLYQSRRLRFARLSGNELEETAADLSAAFPVGIPDFLQYPQIAVTPSGALAVVALQLSHSDSVIEVWGARGVWENVTFTLDGTGWKRHHVLPASTGAHEIRAAAVSDSSGKLWAAWASDGRNFATGQPLRQTVHAARLVESSSAGAIPMKPFAESPDYGFPLHPAEAANLKTVRDYRIWSAGKHYRILRGDLHRHTSLSADGVGDGSLWDFYRYALDAADLDFSTVTDHQGGGSAYNWWKIQKSTDLFLSPGRLTTVYAYERSVLYPNGHRNIVFPRRGAPILPITPAEQRGETRSADAVLPYLRQYNAIAFRHTTATNQGTDWKDHDNQLEPMVEVYQGHRVVYEHEGGPKGATAEKLYMQRSGYQPAGFIWNALAKGYRMGFQAASDHCSTHISYSCILAEDNSREAIIAAMRKRHSYGATDNIVMDFRVKSGGAEYLQGDEVRSQGQYVLTVNAIGTAPIRRVDLIRNEAYVYALTPTGKSSIHFTYTDPHPAPRENRYYVRLEQEDGQLAWSSPVWVFVGRLP